MKKTELREQKFEVVYCDACLKKCVGGEYYQYQLNVRTPKDTNFHIHHNCLMNLIRDNKGVYENKEVFRV